MPSPIHFRVQMEQGAPEIRTEAPPTALVSMTQIPPPTASSCEFLNVCVPEHVPLQGMRLSAVRACACRHRAESTDAHA